MTLPDATFTPSTFGGGWLQPHTRLGAALVREALGDLCEGVPPWPEGWLVEPYEVETVATCAAELGAVVAS